MDDADIQLNRRTRRLRLAAAALLAWSSCVAFFLGRHNNNGNDGDDEPAIIIIHDAAYSSATTTLRQFNPKLPSHIQRLLINSGNNYNNNGTSPLRKQQQHHRQLAAAATSGSSCIQFWHASILPNEPSTCTNSGHYPPEWAHSSVLDYMFHPSAATCCEELLLPWRENGFGDSLEAGIVDDSGGHGGMPTCAVVDACAPKEGAGDEHDKDDMPSYTPPVNNNNHDDDGECDGKSFKKCIESRECGFDEALNACVMLETLNTAVDGIATDSSISIQQQQEEEATTSFASSELSVDTCMGKSKKQCTKIPQCLVVNGICMTNESTTSNNEHGTAGHCRGKTKRQCIRANICEFHASTNACRDTTPPPNLGGGGGSVIAADNDNDNDNIENECNNNKKKYHPTSVLERKCSNGDIYPSIWDHFPERYFFDSAQECCIGFYRDGPTCEIDNVCLKVVPTSTNAEISNIGEPPKEEGVSTEEEVDYCNEKNKRQCAKDDQCDWDSRSKSCSGIQAEAAPPTESPTVSCENRVWHESASKIFTCTNDGNYPPSWNYPSNQGTHLFPTSYECCQAKFYGRPCTVFDSCYESEAPTSASPTPYPTTPAPTTMEPSMTPTEYPTTVIYAKNGSVVDPSCYVGKEWHKSRVPGSEVKCTNDHRILDAWLHPKLKEFYLFETPRDCCRETFGNPNCDLYDVCIEGTYPPTLQPSTLLPTPNPWPTYAPSSLLLHETASTTCNARWHILNKNKHKSTCTNDDNFPDEWKSPSKFGLFLFRTAKDCCDSLFPNEQCNLYNVCPEGMVYTYAPTLVPTAVAPASIMPTKRHTKRPTPKPSRRPYLDAIWYISRVSGQCVQSCQGNSPCEGIKPEWEDGFMTPEACCGSMPWKTFDACLTTPSPTAPPPPTLVPTVRPTRKPIAPPTRPPTRAPVTARPTKAPTPVPTMNCASFKWHMSTEHGIEQACTNSDKFPDAWKQQAEFFFFDDSQTCCQAAFRKDCKTYDWCGALNQVKIGDNKKAAEAALAAEAAAAAAAAAAEQAANASNNDSGGSGIAGNFVSLTSGSDDFEGDGTIPWIYGSPPEWEIDGKSAFLGKHSVTNIITKKPGATSTLKLEVNLSKPLTFECKLKVEVSMPFDQFSFHVNGDQRKTYYAPGPRNEWITLKTGLPPGETTILFQVTNGAKDPGFDRSNNPRHGSGSVCIDSCKIDDL